ncbi:unnamed protein product [Larinioides sclopetarius]|uniref:BRCT domain-containing protein n=1 Tax=Larinioides sclopetarius TaxID=280406 RepID=A0AAV1ZZJ8_9ARAC
MSPLESRNETHANRVRMFGPDKLSQNLKDEKWDCAQVVCTQPFNKNIQFGLSFIKFHSPPEKNEDKPAESEAKNTTVKFGAFRIRYDDDEEDNSPVIGSWQERKNKMLNSSLTSSQDSPSYAAAVLASSNSAQSPQQNNSQKRKLDSLKDDEPPPKKESPVNVVNKEKLGSKDVVGPKKESNVPSAKNNHRTLNQSTNGDKPSTSNNKQGKVLKRKPFNKIMEKVVFVISGFVNPLRSEIRDKAIEMGAKYKGDWDGTCTHLICAFINTPKYLQVRGKGGRIVTKDWIMDCYKKKVPLDWKLYMLGNYTMDESSNEEGNSVGSSEEWSGEDEDEEEMPIKKKRTKKASPKLNGKKPDEVKKVTKPKPESSSDSDDGKPSVSQKIDAKKVQRFSPKKNVPKSSNSVTDQTSKNDSETEDEDALADYIADTDRDSDSGGNTEDEILKVEKENLKKAALKAKSNEDSCGDDSDSSLLPSKVDTSNLPLPELPNLFKRRHFFLYGNFTSNKYHDLQRYITAYNGVIEDYMADSVKYVITEEKWDKNFEEALESNEDLIFVKPDWIFKCHEAQKLLPYQPYIVIPDS